MLHACPRMMTSALFAGLAAAFCGSPVGAKTLHVPSEFPDVKAAMAAASCGDTIQLEAGDHSIPPDTIVEGITLTIQGVPGSGIHIPRGPLAATNAAFLTVRNVRLEGRLHAGENSILLLEGVEIPPVLAGPPKTSVTAERAASVTARSSVLASMDLKDVARVRVENCALSGARGEPGSPGSDGLRLEGCPRVTITNSSVAGGDGGGGISDSKSRTRGTFNAGPGGNGLTALDGTNVRSFNTQFSAGLHGAHGRGPIPADGLASYMDATSTIGLRASRGTAATIGAGAESTAAVPAG